MGRNSLPGRVAPRSGGFGTLEVIALSAASGSARRAAGRSVTLIFQGHGNSCTSAADFDHWTIVMQRDAKVEYSLFGDLDPLP